LRQVCHGKGAALLQDQIKDDHIEGSGLNGIQGAFTGGHERHLDIEALQISFPQIPEVLVTLGD
jgi:hypothetical protein